MALRMLNDAGSEERDRRVKAEKKLRGIHHSKDCSDQAWYREIERAVFAPENEGRWWGYAEIRRRFQPISL